MEEYRLFRCFIVVWKWIDILGRIERAFRGKKS